MTGARAVIVNETTVVAHPSNAWIAVMENAGYDVRHFEEAAS